MRIAIPVWKQFCVPEPIYASWVRRKGDAMALALAQIVYAKRLRAAHAAVALEERLAEQAWKRGPQVTPDNGIGAELEFEMSAHSYGALHNNSKALEPGCEGGEFLESQSFMKTWLNKNERNKRRTAPHSNRVGFTARLEAARAAGQQDQAMTQARVSSILEEAAREGRGKLVA